MSDQRQSSAEAIELVPFGGHTIGHSTENGSIVLLNETARLMLAVYQQSAGKAQAVEQISRLLQQDRAMVETDFDAMLAHWSDAGLFSGKHAALLAGARLLDKFCWNHCVTLGKNKVYLRCNDLAAGSVLNRLLEPLLTDDEDEEISDVVDLIATDGSFLVAVNGRHYWFSEEFAGCRHMFLQALLETALGPGEVGAVLHASAVQLGQSTLLLSGTSGSGKSTMMAQLVMAGGTYLGDDLLALSASGDHVFGLSANISIKPGSQEILDRQLKSNGNPPLPDADEYGFRYWQTESDQNWHKATHLCFPEFRAELTDPKLEQIDELEALHRLTAAGSRACGRNNSIRPMADLCQNIPAFSLRYGPGEDVAPILQELVA
ncbi:MAG: hypothetical protein AAF412_02165 [Pseudomonadota bacterium]